MELTERIGQRLRETRQARGLSLSGLAGRTVSLSKSRISNYEQGIRRMGIEEALELSDALGGVTPSFLLCLEDGPPLSEGELSLLDRYRQASERGRDTILRVAEAQAVYDAGDGPSAQGDPPKAG